MNLRTFHRRLDPNNPIRRAARAIRPLATAGYWVVTPHKIPARIAFIQRLTSKNEELLALNAECLAKVEVSCQRSDMDRPLAFMHIPKSSGLALNDGLRAVLPGTHCIQGFDHRHWGTFRSFETMSPGLRQMICADVLPPAKGIDFVTGHMAYSTLIKSRPSARLMTVLREPRARILSLWMFWRSTPAETLSDFGGFGRILRLARQPLAEFLRHPDAAHQIDNIAVRMLLWPHPLIVDNDFIDDASDERLINEAMERLKAFDFTDFIENPQFENNVRNFLARPFAYRRVNETIVPSEFRFSLKEELTAEALFLIERRSRLDRKLWSAVADERITGSDSAALSDTIFCRAVSRYSELATPFSERSPNSMNHN
jgi:hypothetical protein